MIVSNCSSLDVTWFFHFSSPDSHFSCSFSSKSSPKFSCSFSSKSSPKFSCSFSPKLFMSPYLWFIIFNNSSVLSLLSSSIFFISIIIFLRSSFMFLFLSSVQLMSLILYLLFLAVILYSCPINEWSTLLTISGFTDTENLYSLINKLVWISMSLCINSFALSINPFNSEFNISASDCSFSAFSASKLSGFISIYSFIFRKE